MFNHRFLLIISIVSLSLVAMAVSRSFSDTPSSADDTDRWEAMGKYYANQAMAESDPSLREAQPDTLDSATRSYMGWAEAMEAAGTLGDSDVCSKTTQENILAKIPNNLDSATRSYIGWGLALQAKDDIRALCR